MQSLDSLALAFSKQAADDCDDTAGQAFHDDAVFPDLFRHHLGEQVGRAGDRLQVAPLAHRRSPERLNEQRPGEDGVGRNPIEESRQADIEAAVGRSAEARTFKRMQQVCASGVDERRAGSVSPWVRRWSPESA